MDGSGVILRDGAVVDNSDNGRNEDDSDLLAISENSDQNPQDYLDIKQNERGIRVTVDRRRDEFLTAFGKATLTDRYLMRDEDYQDLFARVAMHYADDSDHAQRIYDYMSQHWFMPSTPVLSNGGTSRGLPISCFLNEAGDSLEGIVGLWNENVWLAARGGGIGSYWGNLRSIGEQVGHNGKTSGVIPFIRVMDSLTLAISQGSLRRGSAAVYLPLSHPEIEEFVELRRPTGGDRPGGADGLELVSLPRAERRPLQQSLLARPPRPDVRGLPWSGRAGLLHVPSTPTGGRPCRGVPRRTSATDP